MKKLVVIIFLTLLGLSFSMSNAHAKNLKKKTQSSIVNPTGVKQAGRLSTNFNFDDLIVSGKYAYPDEAIATVEDEKLLSDLLDFRKEFKDRLKQSAFRH